MNQLSSEAHAFEPSNDDEPAELPCIRVLLVEDDVCCREAMAAALEERGARVTAVGSVQAALASFEDTAPNIVISDIEMPGQDGFDLIQQVRALDGRCCRRTPAIAVTGLSIREAAQAAGFDEHIAKPVDLAFLVGRMRALVGSA
jgi:CheY-like chemotaxis protein